MATAEEDFTFPAAATGTPPRFLESPQLWRPHHQPENLKGKQVEDAGEFDMYAFQEFKASSSSHGENLEAGSSRRGEGDEEEKMDMLWEDLNDEYSGKRAAAHNTDITSPGRRDVRISCVQALKLSKANGHMLSGKKLSIFVFIKILKKAFLVHSSHRTINKQTW